MKPLSVLTVGLLCATCQSASADILISQYYEGSSFNKWIELSNTESSAVTLTGYKLTRYFNQHTETWKFDGAVPGFTQDLDDFSIPGNGFLLLSHSSAALPAYAVADLPSGVINFNGNDSMVLYNTDLGNLGDTAAIVDAIGLTESGNEGANKSFYRLSNEVGFDLLSGSTVLDYLTVWGEKSNGDVDGAATSDAWYLHNFESNATDELTVSLSVATVAENAGAGVVDVTVARTGSTAADLEITLGSDDESEASIPIANLQIPAGQASATFAMAVDAVDDIFTDGTKMVTISATAAGFTAGTAELSVTDDGDVQAIVINEILANPASGGAGDANADGVTDASDDEFIELINVSGADLDLSNWEVHDRTGVNPRHVFTDGTVLKADCAIVVFGGGSIGGLGGTAQYQFSQDFGLSLNNSGDTVTVTDSSGNLVAEVPYGSEGGNGESLTRDPDITGPFVRHSGASGSDGTLFSPGTRIDGSLTCPGAGELSVTLSASSMSENGGSLTATISRAGTTVGDLVVGVRIDDSSEAMADVVGDLTTIPDGQASVEIAINAVDDVAPDGTQTVNVSVIAPDYATGRATFEVDDDGDGAFSALIFNEVLSDPPAGSDPNRDFNPNTVEDEFVELVNVTETSFDLSDFELHDGFGLRHVFPIGTVVGPGQAIVVFGGGSPIGSFGGSLVQTASTGALGLNNSGDSIVLAAPGGAELLRFEYDGSVQDQSMTRDPDIIGSFATHGGAVGAGAALFSPGSHVDGSIFSGGVAPGSIRLEFFDIDLASSDITIRVSGLQPVINYSFDVSVDLGDTELWPSIQGFTTADGTEVSPGLLEFVFNDALISFSPAQYYRVSQP